MRLSLEKTDAILDGICLKRGEFIYVINSYGRFLKRVNWVSKYNFEWRFGWANIDQLTINEDNKSKVRFILNLL